MNERLERLETELRATRQSLEQLEGRVLALEERPGLLLEERHPERVAASLDEELEDDILGVGLPAVEEPAARIGAGLIGGILLMLAGGYLLRAMTESGALPEVLGIAIGLAYAFSWTLVGHVLAARGQRGAAAASGIATALIALPLIWEATVRFEVLPPWAAAGLLLVTGAVILTLVERYRLRPVAWVAVVGMGAASIALMFGTRVQEPYAVILVLLGLTAALIGGRHGNLLSWTAYAFADVGALLLILGSLGEIKLASPGLTIGILVTLFVGFLAIFIYHSWRRGRIGFDEPIQGTVATLLGFGGAIGIASAELPRAATVLAGAGLVIGAAGYVFLLFAFEWTREHRWPFLLYSSLALAVLALSIAVLFPQSGWVFAGFAVVLAGVGVWLDRVSPGLHAAFSILLAALAGGLFAEIRSVLTGSSADPWPALEPAAMGALAAALVCAVLPLKVTSPIWPPWLPRLGRAAVVLVSFLGLGALVVRLAAPGLAGSGAQLDGGALAAVRTGVLAVSVVILAISTRWRPLQSAAWLVWPLLGALGLKLVLEDFPQGRAITLAAALLLYGAALILAPRLMTTPRRVGASEATGDSAAGEEVSD